MGIKNSFRKMVKSFIRWAVDSEPADAPYDSSYTNKVSSVKGACSSNPLDNSEGLNFTVFNAAGGKIIKVHSYDKRLDRSNSSLYIVTEQEDLGEEIAQIITRESLTR